MSHLHPLPSSCDCVTFTSLIEDALCRNFYTLAPEGCVGVVGSLRSSLADLRCTEVSSNVTCQMASIFR